MQNNTSEVFPLFSKPVYLDRLKNISLKEIVENLNESLKESGDVNYKKPNLDISLASVNKNVLEQSKYKNLKKTIMKEFYKYAHDILNYENEFRITTSWFTKTIGGQSSNYHTHNNCMFSGVLYLQTDGLSGNINFTNYDNKRYHLKARQYNLYNGNDFTFEVEEGMIIFFPSEVYHKILQSSSEHIRYSLAFNFIPIGDLWNKDSDSYLYIK